MLYLYHKNTVDFTNNGDPIHHSYDEHVIRDDGFYLTFNLLLDKEEDYKKIKKEMIVSADTPDGINQFRIYDIKNKSNVVEVTAVQLMYDFDNKEVNPFLLKNSTGSQVISRFKSSFKSTLGQFTMDSSVTETHDFATNDEEDDTPSHNALEILNRITNRWDSELMLNGFDIRMIKRLGAKTDALLYEKKNISEFEDASSVSGMITRIHATSKFTPEGKEDEVTLSVTVDSPLINEYAQIYEKSYVNNDCRTEAELIAWTKLKYSTENCDKPSRSITVSTNIIDGTEINYGDELVLKYLVHDVDEIIRCVGYDYDPIKNTYYSVTLGDWKDSFLNTVTSNIIDNTNKQLNQMKNSVTYIAMSANGKNRNVYGPEPVPNPINGDNWYYYEFDRPNDVELRIFQDGFWVVIDFATKKEVEAVLDQADLDRAKAEQDINQALLDAKNYTEVKAQEFDNQLLIVNQNLVTAKNSADAAVLKADKAIEDVGFLKPDVATAKANAATAIQDAATATQNATTAIQNAQTALNSVTTLSQEVDVSITNINGELATKVSQTTFNTLSGTVGTHTTQISQTQNALLAKAESSLVNTIKGTVDTHTTQIKVASDGLELKADSSLVNTVKGTVDSHSSLISANSQAINARLTSTQIETLLTGKQYVNQTALNATSSGLTAQITQVSTDLSNLEIGGRNYFTKNTTFNQQVANNTFRPRDVATPNGFYVTGNSATNGSVRIPNIITENGWWTVSFDIKGSQSTPVGFYVDICDLGTIRVVSNNTNTYRRVSVSVNVTNYTSALYNFVDFGAISYAYIWVDNIKVEKGQKATDWSPAPEDMATLEKFTTLDIKVTGIQTTVGNKADKTEVTQLANQWTQTTALANGHTGQISNLGEQINFRVTSSQVTAAILADKTIKDTRDANETPIWYIENYPRQEIREFKRRTAIGVPGSSTYVQATTKVPWAGGTSGGVPIQIAESNDGVYQRVSNSAGSAWLAWDKVAESSKLISQINISTEGILLQGKRIQLDGDVTMTSAFVTRLDVLTLTAVYADIATLKTKVLTANVVDSTMINANTALITKLFATDANVQLLTAKTAFINSVKAIDIAADRITAGTLNASNVNIVGLNVNNLVGNITSFVQSNWNQNGSDVRITSGGIVSTAANGAQTLLQNGVLYVKTASQGLGTIGAALDGNENLFTIDIVNNQSFTIRYQTTTGVNSTYRDIIGYYDYLNTVVINNATQINGWLRMNGALDMQQSDILAARYVTSGVFQTGTIGSILNDGNRIAAKGVSGVSLGVGGQVNGGFSRIFWLDGTYIYAEKNLSMQGNSITSQSDRRLKKVYGSTNKDSLAAISRWNFVDYEWIDTVKHQGIKFGLIAQDTPELMLYDAVKDIYSIDNSKQTMMNSHAINQLNSKVVSMVSIVNSNQATMKQALNAANTALSETQKLKQEIQELRQKIKNLESAA